MVNKINSGTRSRQNWNARCVICNSVSLEEISSETGTHFHRGFYETYYGQSGLPAYICYDCDSVHDDIMTEWEMEDEADEDE